MTATDLVTAVVAVGSLAALLAMGGLTYLGAVALLDRDITPAACAPATIDLPVLATPAALAPAAQPRPAGRHRCPVTMPLWQQIARGRAYVARHCEEEIPPSIRVPALLMDPVRRARELRRQLGNGRPALDLRTRAHLAPTAWAARLGRPVQLGMGRAIGGVA